MGHGEAAGYDNEHVSSGGQRPQIVTEIHLCGVGGQPRIIFIAWPRVCFSRVSCGPHFFLHFFCFGLALVVFVVFVV